MRDSLGRKELCLQSTRETIQLRLRAFYRRVHDYLEELAHRNPEESHYKKHIWLSVFGSNFLELDSTRTKLHVDHRLL